MTARVLTSPPHNCKTDGHLIALRLQRHLDTTSISVTLFCEACRGVFLPSISMDGLLDDWLMRQVEKAQYADEDGPAV